MASSKVSKVSLILSVCANVLAIVVIVLLLLLPKNNNKKDLDSNVAMSDATYVYDGTEKSLAIDELPNVCTVKYENNNQKNAGEYKVKANINGQGYFNDKTLESNLKITQRDLATTKSSYFGFNNMNIKYDGNSHTIEPKFDVENITVDYIEPHEFTNEGIYSIEATIKNNDASGNTNYINELTVSAELTIYSGNAPSPVPTNPGKIKKTDNTMIIFDMDVQPVEFYNSWNDNWDNTSTTFIYMENATQHYIERNQIKEIEFTCKVTNNNAPREYLEGFCVGMTNLEVANITLPQNLARVDDFFLAYAFKDCVNLKTIGEGFLLPTNTLEIKKSPISGSTYADNNNFLYETFSGCTKLENLPSQFTLPNQLTISVENYIQTRTYNFREFMAKTFYKCTSIVNFPSTFRLPSTINIPGSNQWIFTNFMYQTFAMCTSLEKLPNGFDLIHNVSAPAVPDFTNTCMNFYRETFSNCSSLQTLPSSFRFPNRTISDFIPIFINANGTPTTNNPGKMNFMRQMFESCTSLTSTGGTDETIWGDGDANWTYYDYSTSGDPDWTNPPSNSSSYIWGLLAFKDTPLITSFNDATNPCRSFYPGLVLTIKRNS